MSVSTGPRGPYAKTAERREEILAAAIEVFSTSGYSSGSLREVSDRVGISLGGLLHHFASKYELLEAVLDRRDADDSRRVGIDRLQGLALVRGIVALVAYNATQPGLVGLYCVLSAEATSPAHPAHDYFVRRYAWTTSLLRRAFADAQADGQVRPEADPDRCARTLVAIMDGLQVQWLLDPGATDMAAHLGAHVEALLTERGRRDSPDLSA